MSRFKGTYDEYQRAMSNTDIPRRIAIHTKVIPETKIFGRGEKGRIVEKTIDDGTGIKKITNRYDKFGRLRKEKVFEKHGIEKIEREFVIKKERRKLIKDIKAFLKGRLTVQAITEGGQLIINDISETINEE